MINLPRRPPSPQSPWATSRYQTAQSAPPYPSTQQQVSCCVSFPGNSQKTKKKNTILILDSAEDFYYNRSSLFPLGLSTFSTQLSISFHRACYSCCARAAVARLRGPKSVTGPHFSGARCCPAHCSPANKMERVVIVTAAWPVLTPDTDVAASQ